MTHMTNQPSLIPATPLTQNPCVDSKPHDVIFVRRFTTEEGFRFTGDPNDPNGEIRVSSDTVFEEVMDANEEGPIFFCTRCSREQPVHGTWEWEEWERE